MGSIGLLILTHLILPLVFLIWLWRGKVASWLDWLAKLLVVLFYSFHLYLSGRWDIVGYSLRFGLLVLLIAATAASFVPVRGLPLRPPQGLKSYLDLGINSAVAGFFLTLLLSYLPQGYVAEGAGVELALPLRAGTYYVAHGGSSPILNYHNVDAAQRYALDLVELNAWGTRARGLLPRMLSDYVIFEKPLYSPCDGVVRATANDQPDLTPSLDRPAQNSSAQQRRQRQQLAGNYVLLTCRGADILMAHLQRGSVTVQPDDVVETGQAIAKIGNSGNTSEPHLHIHARTESPGAALLEGEGIPIRFNGKFLVRNSLFRA
jgi:Peptidase family M23